MKTYLDCIPCFMQQALNTGRAAGMEDVHIKALLDTIGAKIKHFKMQNNPPEMANIIYKEIRKTIGQIDPYKDLKQQHIRESLALYPELKETVEYSEDKLLTAIRIAIAGNIIDMGVNKKFNIYKNLVRSLNQDFAIFDYLKFKATLQKARSVLYLGDNAGESVFDKVLIEELRKPVNFVVRGIPVINDVTKQDAIDSGIDNVAGIMSSGSTAPATILKLCNKRFLSKFDEADMIISKGQGNFEGLSGTHKPVFFLLKAKCHIIAKELGVNEGDIILKSAI